MRIIHLLVIAALVFAAAYVYRIKMDSTARTERVLRLQAEIREQRDAIAVLRAEWARLDAPLRLQGLAERHLGQKTIAYGDVTGSGKAKVTFDRVALDKGSPCVLEHYRVFGDEGGHPVSGLHERVVRASGQWL